MSTLARVAISERFVFTVTDLKQYAYCPRVVFYTYCLPLVRPTTYKMDAGAAAHEKAEALERRRTLAAYGLEAAQRHFDVAVASEQLGLNGRIDMVLEVGEGAEREWIPVDYKQTTRPTGRHIRRQLTAYAMMLEETWGGIARRGFVYSLMTRKAEELTLIGRARDDVRTVVAAMREMVEREVMPDPPDSRRPCLNCEFRRFCNDVL
ncbi:MAG: CRISPR-associated protein Cas4 [Anaerolineales bacterium]|nr:CRISPR-associated protein Cas4 [Anaerolineales bacterium]